MRKVLAISVLLTLGGCATQEPEPQINCDLTPDTPQCQSQRILNQNDLMQAKVLTTSGTPENLPLASALLERIHVADYQGEVAFYKALILIRQNPKDTIRIVQQLEQAADLQHPHATALLFRMYHDPYLLSRQDLAKADLYRKRYAQLDVARSGYPSFDQAVELTHRLFANQVLAEKASAPVPAPQPASAAKAAPAETSKKAAKKTAQHHHKHPTSKSKPEAPKATTAKTATKPAAQVQHEIPLKTEAPAAKAPAATHTTAH